MLGEQVVRGQHLWLSVTVLSIKHNWLCLQVATCTLTALKFIEYSGNTVENVELHWTLSAMKYIIVHINIRAML